MNSIFKQPKTSPKRGRNGFDLSFRRLFTSPCGMMLPVAFDFTNPGDKYKLNANMLIRTMPVQTAAFTRFKAHVDWHYVPMRLLYSFWNEFYNQVFDGHTNFVKKTDNFALPVFQFTGVNAAITSPETYDSLIKTLSSSGSSPKYRLQLDRFATPLVHNMRRLWDLFGYGTVGRYSSVSNVKLTAPATPYLAYHKIFYSHYNNSIWFANDPSFYNVDSFHGTFISDSKAIPIISTIHYAPWRNDFFHNIYPSPTMSSNYVNSLFNQGDVFSKINKEGYDSNLVLTSSPSDLSDGSAPVITQDQYDSVLSISSSDIRSLFALDRLSRVTALAGSHYDEQLMAHFGVKINKLFANESQFIGSQSVDINIAEVVSTATTDSSDAGSTLGDIAGKGYGLGSGKDVNFTAKEHGVIMAIFYIEPFLDYSSQGIDPKLRYTHTLDFYHPELDDLGMQPFDSNTVSVRNLASPVISGWQYRYSELKTGFDKVNEGLYEVANLRTWQTNYQQSLDDNNFYNWDSFANFYISPQYTNDIFYSDYLRYTNGDFSADMPNGTDYLGSAGHNWQNPIMSASQVYRGDNFLCSINFKIFKTSIMSVHSLPKLR